jgi:hypothetical protein
VPHGIRFSLKTAGIFATVNASDNFVNADLRCSLE